MNDDTNQKAIEISDLTEICQDLKRQLDAVTKERDEANRLRELADSRNRDREHQWMFGVSVERYILDAVKALSTEMRGDECMLDLIRRWHANSAQLAAANADRVRLDLVEKCWIHNKQGTTNQQWGVVLPYCETAFGPTLRAAIDAAALANPTPASTAEGQ